MQQGIWVLDFFFFRRLTLPHLSFSLHHAHAQQLAANQHHCIADFAFMGYSIRVESPFPLRYTEWLRWNGTRPYWDEIFARELYNHTGDTGAGIGIHGSAGDLFENENLAARPGLASLVATLSAQLRREFSQYILSY